MASSVTLMAIPPIALVAQFVKKLEITEKDKPTIAKKIKYSVLIKNVNFKNKI